MGNVDYTIARDSGSSDHTYKNDDAACSRFFDTIKKNDKCTYAQLFFEAGSTKKYVGSTIFVQNFAFAEPVVSENEKTLDEQRAIKVIDFIKQNGFATQKDLGGLLDLSKPVISKLVQILKKQGCIYAKKEKGRFDILYLKSDV